MSSLQSSRQPKVSPLSIVETTTIRRSMDAANRPTLNVVANSKGATSPHARSKARKNSSTVVPSATQNAALSECLHGPDPLLMKKQMGFIKALLDYYFRLEIDGWDKLPNEPALLIGGHSGGPLTMDAWTLAYAWWRHFEGSRNLHATAHDVLMKTPGLGSYFRRMGVISPTRKTLRRHLSKVTMSCSGRVAKKIHSVAGPSATKSSWEIASVSFDWQFVQVGLLCRLQPLAVMTPCLSCQRAGPWPGCSTSKSTFALKWPPLP